MPENLLDRRVERSKAAVLAETYRLLTAVGMGGVSLDDVARNSGVAKTTIYRHWPSRSALLIDACSRMGGTPPEPRTGSLRGDLDILAKSVAEQLRTAAWPRILPSIVDAAERDPEIAAMQAALHEGNMATFHAVVESAKQRGELAATVDAADLIASLIGPLFYRRWFSKETIDETFVDRLIDRAVAAPTASSTPKPDPASVSRKTKARPIRRT